MRACAEVCLSYPMHLRGTGRQRGRLCGGGEPFQQAVQWLPRRFSAGRCILLYLLGAWLVRAHARQRSPMLDLACTGEWHLRFATCDLLYSPLNQVITDVPVTPVCCATVDHPRDGYVWDGVVCLLRKHAPPSWFGVGAGTRSVGHWRCHAT